MHVCKLWSAHVQRCGQPFQPSARITEGADNRPLFGQYPRQRFGNGSVKVKLGPAFDSARGKNGLLVASQFKKRSADSGFVPHWPGVKGSPHPGELTDLMRTDQRNARRMQRDGGDCQRTSQ